ncbi:flagellar export chaperone FliS [Photobacterium gaetbulicola]|uniref:Flagellar secretion chaperone FliS n=1 Tax=Photobacterium gaetbulicola Gung47 TaxID=658445 RepID=A0A0C5WKX2_9GAMM|nr:MULTISPECIES: flagellar export chaperone FliS [Photobacterium]AJR07808.1 flagellin-specific chaperone FliS [Photobacterium gaetbulicola Gung47]PSU03397.1 flagellar export chaperone FliS [Photobacterium gaetbulicola]WEM43007.1 flagellar export chaperone FliS [Photobacterium sp. DA100]
MLMDDSGFDAYQQVEVEAQAAAASPYQLVLMLIDGFMDNLTRAEGHMAANRLKERGEAIGKCIDIIGGLNSALDMRQGGELAQQMNQLYDFCSMRLFEASVHNDAGKLGEVRTVMGNIQQGWHNFGVAHDA